MLPQIKRTILSQETWNKFTSEEKTALRKFYNEKLSNAKGAEDRGFYDTAESIKGVARNMERFFGKENLQSNEDNSEPTEVKIKTWADVEKESLIDETLEEQLDALSYWNGDTKAICDKCTATLKIAKLIELGYGGIITDEEYNTYKTSSNVYFNILCEHNGMLIIKRLNNDDDEVLTIRNLLTFRSFELAKEFMSYPDNVKLVDEYYMI